MGFLSITFLLLALRVKGNISNTRYSVVNYYVNYGKEKVFICRLGNRNSYYCIPSSTYEYVIRITKLGNLYTGIRVFVRFSKKKKNQSLVFSTRYVGI